MDDLILITELNDFIFCPISIYFHKVYGNMDKTIYQSSDQINGTNAHSAVDNATYSSESHIFMALDVYCEELGLVGKIDLYDADKCILRERKKKIKNIYDGYIFQVYAQCMSLREMGYQVKKIELYSMDDHKTYSIPLPEDDKSMFDKFKNTITNIRNFNVDEFMQKNIEKCKRCIYEPACDRTLITEV